MTGSPNNKCCFLFLFIALLWAALSSCASGEYLRFESNGQLYESCKQSGIVTEKDFAEDSLKGGYYINSAEAYSFLSPISGDSYRQNYNFTGFLPYADVKEKGRYFNPNNWYFLTIPAIVGGLIYLYGGM